MQRANKNTPRDLGVFGEWRPERNQSALRPHEEELWLCDEQQPLMSCKIASICPQMSCTLQVGVVGGVQHPLCDDSPPQQDELHLLLEQHSLGGHGSHFGAQGATEHAESKIRCSSASVTATPRRVRRSGRLGFSIRKNCEIR